MLALNTTKISPAPGQRVEERPMRRNKNPFARTDFVEGNKQTVVSIVRARIGDEARRLGTLLKDSDPDTYWHCRRVADLSVLLAERLGVKYSLRQNIREAAELHDIGKLCVPAYILNRRTPLHWSHWKTLHRIPELSESLARAAEYEALTRVLILRVHERADRGGYPYGLGGKDVPFAAQIIHVADMFDSLNTTLPFRPAYPMNLTLEIISAYAERGAFDKRISDTLNNCVTQTA
jgi:HD-GYP domain-containing protein (c-di-GMP phosphodiesterase class II)